MTIDIASFVRRNIGLPLQPVDAQDPAHPLRRCGSHASRFHTPAPRTFATPFFVATTVLPHRYRGLIASQTVKRTKTRQLRFTPGEDTKIAEDARAAGLEFSEYVRRECGLKNFGRSALRSPGGPAKRAPARAQTGRPPVGPDFEQRVRQAALRMPRRAAENVVRKEEAKERARGE